MAGYLWLIGLWLAFSERLPSRSDLPHSVDSLVDVGGSLTPFAAATALSFAAYLVGVAAEGMYRLPIVAAAGLEWQERQRNDCESAKQPSYPPPELRRTPAPVHTRYRRRDLFTLSESSYAALDSVVETELYEAMGRLGTASSEFIRNVVYSYGHDMDPDRAVEPRGTILGTKHLIVTNVVARLELVAKRLITDKPELYSAYDRLRAEGEFRLEIFLPLLLLVGALGYHWSGWFFVALIPVLRLAGEGVRKRRNAGDTLIDAIQNEQVKPPAFDDLDRVAERVRQANSVSASPPAAAGPEAAAASSEKDDVSSSSCPTPCGTTR